MRLLAVLAIAVGMVAAVDAAAAREPNSSASRPVAKTKSKVPPPKVRLDLRNAAFVQAAPAETETFSRLLDHESYVLGQGLTARRTGEVALFRSPTGTAVDSLRVSVAGVYLTPGGLPLAPDRAEFDPRTYEVSLIRDWPAALRMEAGALDLDVSPHASVGMGTFGGTAEAGAVVRLGQNLDDKVAGGLGQMGVRDGASFGNQGRWYLFAAASGRAVGMNMLRQDGDWYGAGWSTDPSSGLVGDAQVGVGWRRGAVQTSLGLVHREVKGQHMIWGQETKDDSLVAFSLSIKPRN
jgi:hypothetical protein